MAKANVTRKWLADNYICYGTDIVNFNSYYIIGQKTSTLVEFTAGTLTLTHSETIV